MLISHVTGRRLRLECERGFTLVEMLVVMLAGTVVMIALFTILDVTLNQATRAFSKVDATQRTRTALETIENELHSACVVGGVTPIQAGSSSSSLMFVSQYGTAPSPTPIWHVIALNGTALTDSTYSVAGTAPSWTQGSALSPPSTTLLTNVLSAGFQYFAYQEPLQSNGQPYTDGAGNPYMMLEDGINTVPGTSVRPAASPLATPLSVTNAQQAAEVLINLVVGPGGGAGENTNIADAADTVSDAVVLRLTPAANHLGNGTTFGPCQ